MNQESDKNDAKQTAREDDTFTCGDCEQQCAADQIICSECADELCEGCAYSCADCGESFCRHHIVAGQQLAPGIVSCYRCEACAARHTGAQPIAA